MCDALVAWSPSAVYRVVHVRGLRLEELRISNAVMEKARNGQANYQEKICIAFRKRVAKDSRYDPGWIEFDHLRFTKLRDVPGPNKKGTP